MTQRDRLPCDCGGIVLVTPTDSPHLFDLHCETCGYLAWQAWATKAPPPEFKLTVQQQGLFA